MNFSLLSAFLLVAFPGMMHTQAQADDIASFATPNMPEIIGKCSPGEEFRVGCNTCLCSGDGTDLTCTKNDCDLQPVQRDSETYTDIKPEERSFFNADRAHKYNTFSCKPSEIFQTQCNQCKCLWNGVSAECFNSRCLGFGMSFSPSFSCVPREVFRTGCHDSCVCALDARSATCSLNKCRWSPTSVSLVAHVQGSLYNPSRSGGQPITFEARQGVSENSLIPGEFAGFYPLGGDETKMLWPKDRSRKTHNPINGQYFPNKISPFQHQSQQKQISQSARDPLEAQNQLLDLLSQNPLSQLYPHDQLTNQNQPWLDDQDPQNKLNEQALEDPQNKLNNQMSEDQNKKLYIKMLEDKLERLNQIMQDQLQKLNQHLNDDKQKEQYQHMLEDEIQKLKQQMLNDQQIGADQQMLADQLKNENEQMQDQLHKLNQLLREYQQKEQNQEMLADQLKRENEQLRDQLQKLNEHLLNNQQNEQYQRMLEDQIQKLNEHLLENQQKEQHQQMLEDQLRKQIELLQDQLRNLNDHLLEDQQKEQYQRMLENEMQDLNQILRECQNQKQHQGLLLDQLLSQNQQLKDQLQKQNQQLLEDQREIQHLFSLIDQLKRQKQMLDDLLQKTKQMLEDQTQKENQQLLQDQLEKQDHLMLEDLLKKLNQRLEDQLNELKQLVGDKLKKHIPLSLEDQIRLQEYLDQLEKQNQQLLEDPLEDQLQSQIQNSLQDQPLISKQRSHNFLPKANSELNLFNGRFGRKHFLPFKQNNQQSPYSTMGQNQPSLQEQLAQQLLIKNQRINNPLLSQNQPSLKDQLSLLQNQIMQTNKINGLNNGWSSIKSRSGIKNNSPPDGLKQISGLNDPSPSSLAALKGQNHPGGFSFKSRSANPKDTLVVIRSKNDLTLSDEPCDISESSNTLDRSYAGDLMNEDALERSNDSLELIDDPLNGMIKESTGLLKRGGDWDVTNDVLERNTDFDDLEESNENIENKKSLVDSTVSMWEGSPLYTWKRERSTDKCIAGKTYKRGCITCLCLLDGFTSLCSRSCFEPTQNILSHSNSIKSQKSQYSLANTSDKKPSFIVDDSSTQFPLKVQQGRYPLASQQSQYPLTSQQSQYPLKGLPGQYPSYALGLYPSDSGISVANSPKLSGPKVIYQFYVPKKNGVNNLGGQSQSDLLGLLVARPLTELEGLSDYQTKVFGKQNRGPFLNYISGPSPSYLPEQSSSVLEHDPANIYKGRYPSSQNGQSSSVNRPWGNLPGQMSSTNLPGQYSAKGLGRQKREAYQSSLLGQLPSDPQGQLSLLGQVPGAAQGQWTSFLGSSPIVSSWPEQYAMKGFGRRKRDADQYLKGQQSQYGLKGQKGLFSQGFKGPPSQQNSLTGFDADPYLKGQQSQYGLKGQKGHFSSQTVQGFKSPPSQQNSFPGFGRQKRDADQYVEGQQSQYELQNSQGLKSKGQQS